MKNCLKVLTISAIAAVALSVAARTMAQSSPAIKIHAGKYYDWYTDQKTWDSMKDLITPDFAIFDNAVDQIDADWGTPAPTTHMYCYVVPGGTGGAFATGDISEVSAARGASPSPGIGIDYNLFQAKGYGVTGGTAIVFGVHETVNDMTGIISAGWPRDWWADDRSPFPGMTEIHILNELGYNSIATADDKDLSHDPLYIMDKNIQAKYGWGIYSRMFGNMATNHISWGDVDGGSNPSALLTNMVCAYITLGSGDTLANVDTLFKSGSIPGYNMDRTQDNLNSLGYGGPLPVAAVYTLTSVASGLVLDDGTDSASTKVQFYYPNKTTDHKWNLSLLANGKYTIQSAKSGLAVDAGANKSGTYVGLKALVKSSAKQQWTVKSTLAGYVIMNAKSGLELDGGSSKTGSELVLKAPDDSVGEKWIIH